MFSHLSKRELLLYSVLSALGILFIIIGIVFFGNSVTADRAAILAVAGAPTLTQTTPVTDHPKMTVVVTTHTDACGTLGIGVSWEIPGAPADVYYKVFREGHPLYEGRERKFLDRELSPGSKNSYIVYAFGLNQNLLGSGYAIGIAPPPCTTQTIETAPSNATSFSADTAETDTRTSNTSPAAPSSVPKTLVAEPLPKSVPTVPQSDSTTRIALPPVKTLPPSEASGIQPVVPQTDQPAVPETPPVKSVEREIVKPAPKPTPKITPTSPPIKTTGVHPAAPSTNQQEASTTPTDSAEREVITSARATALAPFSTTTEKKIATLFTLVAVFDEADHVRVESRKRIIALIDQKLLEVQAMGGSPDGAARHEELIRVRAMIIAHISGRLDETLDTDEQIARTTEEIVGAFESLTPLGVSHDADRLRMPIESALLPLKDAARVRAMAIEEKGASSLFTDTNNDGISDYESEHVYNINPVKPSPLSEHNGKRITAGEKIILGFDPTKEELVPITPEEPEASLVPIATSYSVSSVGLTTENKVAFQGRAFPNSHVTLFIYSTPIVVTVKTDADGAWQYTLNKELADGSHTVSVATVDNSGRILAKSASIPFTKTAQAATLDSSISGFVASNDQPSLLSVRTMYLLGMILAGMILLTLGIIGLRLRKPTSTDTVVGPPTEAPQ